MKRIIMAAIVLFTLYALPVTASAEEITIAEVQELRTSGGYPVVITAGIAGVGASAGLLLLSNRNGF